MDTKLIISDVDGTLIDKTEEISQAFNELSDIVRTNKIPFTIASGRCYKELKMFIEHFDIQLPVIVNNGAGGVKNGELIWSNLIDPFMLKEAMLCADRMDMVIVTSDGLMDTAYRHNAYIQNQIEKFGRYNRFHIPLESEWKDLKIQKLLLIDPQKPGRIDEVLKHLEPYKEHLNIVRYDARSADIMTKDSTKAKGILKVARSLQVELENVMALGDARNDMEMIQQVGKGIAVGNANEELKKHAYYVCENENSAGVLEAVNKFYLKKQFKENLEC